MNELTKGRVYGTVCPKHPELEGLRTRPRIKRIRRADDSVDVVMTQGICVECNRVNNARGAERREVTGEVKTPDGVLFLAQALGVASIPNGRLSIRHRMEA